MVAGGMVSVLILDGCVGCTMLVAMLAMLDHVGLTLIDVASWCGCGRMWLGVLYAWFGNREIFV